MKATALVSPRRLWTAREVLVRPSPVPAAAGVYGWHFKQRPIRAWMPSACCTSG